MSRTSRVQGLLGLAAALCTGCHALGEGRGTLGLFGERDPRVLYAIETDAPVVALTIDDGPDPQSTLRILDVLAEHEASATFFVTTSHVPGNEPVLEAIVAAGHELGNHHMRDVPSIELGPGEFERGLVEAHEVLSAWSSPHWFRPASGWYHDWMLDILDAHGYRAALGTVYPLDAQIPSVGLASWWIAQRAVAGSIIILHDGGGRGDRTVQVLERSLPGLHARGLEVVTLSELVQRAEGPAVPPGSPEGRAQAAAGADFPGNP